MLRYHWPIFQKLAETNHGSIIRASIAPYQNVHLPALVQQPIGINDTVH